LGSEFSRVSGVMSFIRHLSRHVAAVRVLAPIMHGGLAFAEDWVWVPNARVASEIAEAVLSPLNKSLRDSQPFVVELHGDRWKVMSKIREIKPNAPITTGGGFALWIDRKSGAIFLLEFYP
jgi:hypothetical protein